MPMHLDPRHPTLIMASERSTALRPHDPATDCLSRQIAEARKGFTTRRVDFSLAKGLLSQARPAPGDLVLARIEEIGQHPRLELTTGRRAKLYPGDTIIVTFGARYAPDQFEAEVPEDLAACDLVAAGGVAGLVMNRHARMRRPTRIMPIGLLTTACGKTLNVAQFSLADTAERPVRVPVIAVVGSSMNAGKTTTAAGLIHGLRNAGLRVAGLKVTGTGSGGDLWSMSDAGAAWAFDFTDMGHATTAGLSPRTLEQTAIQLIRHAADLGSDAIVLEVADGIFQTDTAALLQSGAFTSLVDEVVFAAGDALGGVAGCDWLARQGIPAAALSGIVTTSPLAIREIQANCAVPVATLGDLSDPHFATRLCFGIKPSRPSRVA